jgi:hypothetical protein
MPASRRAFLRTILPGEALAPGRHRFDRKSRIAGARALAQVLLLGIAAQLYAPLASALAPATLAPGETIVLDGRLDDRVWSRAAPMELAWQYLPVAHKPAPARTTVQVAIGRNALYFAIRAWDPDPALIRAPLVRRDHVLFDQDFVSIYLDSLGHGRTATFVRVNARGVIADGVYSADTQNEDLAPDFEVDAASMRLPDGYSVEIRIPFSALRFGKDAVANWQFIALRCWPRGQTARMVNVDASPDDPSFLAKMEPLEGFAGPQASSELLLRPTVSLHQSRSRTDEAASSRSDALRPGLDAKWRPSPDWVADLTIRPDFSQVDLDVPQLTSNQQFALSLPEKRPFLLESTELFETPGLPSVLGGGGERPIYTRTVTALDSGLRATHRTEDGEATLLAVHDAGGGQVLLPNAYSTGSALQPASEAAIARWRSTRSGTTLGGVLSHRSYDDGSGSNEVLGPDVVWQATPADQVHGELLGSLTTAEADGKGGLHRSSAHPSGFAYADYSHTTERYFAFLGAEQIGEGFRADNGYIFQSGFRRVTGTASAKWHPEGMWTNVQPYLWFQDTQARADSATINSSIVPGLQINGPHDLMLDFETHPTVAQRVLPTGALHRFSQSFVDITAVPAAWFYTAEARCTFGRKVDVANDRTASGANWMLDSGFRALDHFELGLHMEQDFIEGRQGARTLSDTLSQVLALAHLDAVHSLRAIWQHHSTRRLAEFPTDVPSSYTRTDAVSLLLGWRPSSVRGLWLGATRSQTTGTIAPTGQSLELFVTLDWSFRP